MTINAQRASLGRQPLCITPEDMMVTIRKTPVGKAPGVDGWRYNHYQWASGSQQQVAADSGDVDDANEDNHSLN